jgi:peptide/nickel transport system permease protein
MSRNPRFLVSAALLLGVVLFAVVGPLLPGRGDPLVTVGGLYDPPSGRALLGTDNFAHDVLTQLMHGARTSLLIGVVAGLMATAVGVAIGTLAGFRGGFVEEALMGVTNVIIAIPVIVILILLSVALGARTLVAMALIIGVTSWPWLARSVRAQAASLRTREHVDIARLSGEGTARLIAFQVLPYMLSYVALAFVLQLASAVLTEAGLSLLGLGPSNSVSLGVVLYWAILQDAVRTGAWWAFLTPAVLLTAVAFSLLMLQTSLDEVFNPRLRAGGRA